MQTILIELPEAIYRAASDVARITKRSITDIVQESLQQTLPPLDDVDPEEATFLASLSLMKDSALWQIGRSSLAVEQQIRLQELLNQQSSEGLQAEEQLQLQELLDEYGQLMVRKSHAWLLLARRGYQVPPQHH